jgi:hypothetical protein
MVRVAELEPFVLFLCALCVWYRVAPQLAPECAPSPRPRSLPANNLQKIGFSLCIN